MSTKGHLITFLVATVAWAAFWLAFTSAMARAFL